MNADNLIFIVSQPRSGSTLLQGVLSNNDYVNTVSEPWLLLPFLNIFDSSLIEAKYSHHLAITGVFDFANKAGGKDVLIEKLRDFLLGVYGPLSIGNVKYILDKTPRYYEILPHIQKVFPEAKIILLKRNPFAVLNSIIDTWGDTNTIADLYTFKRDILYAPFLIQTFLEENRSNDEHVREVFYENLVQKQEKEIEELYKWLGIPYDSSVLDYSKNDRYKGLMGDQKGIKERRKPTDESVDTWQRKFTDTYWGDFFKGYSAFLGKDFISSYGKYSTELIGKNIHETLQFQKFKYFSEDKLIDINFVDAIKDYKRYDLTTKQLNIQEEQLRHQGNQLEFQKEQFSQQKGKENQQREKETLQLEQQKKSLNFQEEQLRHQKKQLEFQKEQFERQQEKENQQIKKETQQLEHQMKLLNIQEEQLKHQKNQLKFQKEQFQQQGMKKNQKLQQEIEQKEKALKQLQKEKEALVESLSWRVTQPFRKVKELLR